jgi:hypothetical protein
MIGHRDTGSSGTKNRRIHASEIVERCQLRDSAVIQDGFRQHG